MAPTFPWVMGHGSFIAVVKGVEGEFVFNVFWASHVGGSVAAGTKVAERCRALETVSWNSLVGTKEG